MGAIDPVGSHLAPLIPSAGTDTLRRLEAAVRQQTFHRRDVLHARGMQLPPFVVLDGYVMLRRVVETGQVRAALIAGPGYLGGLRSISNPDAEAALSHNGGRGLTPRNPKSGMANITT